MEFAADLRERFPIRLHVAVILAGTLLVGLLSSAVALQAGVHSMPWRYLLGLGASYLAFLGLVRVWIAYIRGWRLEADPGDLLDCYDGGSSAARSFEAGGGRFGGGGAHGSWGDGGGASTVSDGASSDLSLDLDDGIVILLFAALAVAMLGGAAYLLSAGPGVLTEAAFEFVLAGALAPRTASARAGRWLTGLVKATVVPFVVVAVLAAALGSFAQDLCPEALRLRDVAACLGR